MLFWHLKNLFCTFGVFFKKILIIFFALLCTFWKCVFCDDTEKKTNWWIMNESRYFMFWFYQIALHNLDVEGLDSMVPDPCGDFWKTKVKIIKVDLNNLPQQKKENDEDMPEKIFNYIVKDARETERPFFCPICGAGYKSDGYLDRHMQEKHSDDKNAECQECGKILFNKQSLDRHILTMHRVWKICKIEFSTKIEKEEHILIHTTCNICNLKYPSESKLKRQMSDQYFVWFFQKINQIFKISRLLLSILFYNIYLRLVCL